MQENITTKSALRTIAKANLLSNASERRGKSSLIWDRLSQLDVFKEAVSGNGLMAYLDFDHEVQTTRFLTGFLGIPQSVSPSLSGEYRKAMKSLWGADVPKSNIVNQIRSVFIPRCEKNEIVPYSILSLDELAPGYRGIPEPNPCVSDDPARKPPPGAIRMILVPGLAFDTSGTRLGRGKGYYDRFLGGIPNDVITIGLAFECQILGNLPRETYDQAVDLIVTEDRIIKPLDG